MGASRPVDDRSRWDPVNDFLVSFLERSDPRLLRYLGSGGRLSAPTIRRLRHFAGALLDAEISPGRLAREWPDWFLLTPAFVAANGTLELADLASESGFRGKVEARDGASLTEADHNYLRALREALDEYS